MLPEDEFVMGDIQVLAGLKMGSERLRLFFTPTRILVAHIGKRGVGSQVMGSFFGWLSGAIEDIFRSGKESFTKRESKMSTPKDILASDRDNFSISYEEIITVDIDLALTAASFTILTRDDKFHFSVLGRREVLLDLLRKVLPRKLRFV